MERLTYEIMDGGMVTDKENVKEFEIEDWVTVYAGNAVFRLAEYEDTGLTPPEIMELKERDTAMEINEILAEQRITAIKAWKSVKDDGLPPVGSCLIVTIKNHGYGDRRELRYPVHYLQKNYAPGYAFYMNGTDILLPEYSEVVAWMNVPMPYDGE